MAHFVINCRALKPKCPKPVRSLHKFNIRGMNAGLLISCQETANGETLARHITDDAMDSVGNNYDSSVLSKSAPP